MNSEKLSDTDEEITSRVLAGDIEQYAQIVSRYEAKLSRYVVYLIHDKTLAKDVVQETFLKAYRNLRSFNPKYKFSSWIYRIAHNEAMNIIKKSRIVIGDEDVYDMADIRIEEGLSELIDKDMLNEQVHGCVDKLEPKYREVIQLIYFEHMKYDEVADILRMPSSTVGVRLSRAKSRLREICTQKGVKR